jgi:hypothetical protein
MQGYLLLLQIHGTSYGLQVFPNSRNSACKFYTLVTHFELNQLVAAHCHYHFLVEENLVLPFKLFPVYL